MIGDARQRSAAALGRELTPSEWAKHPVIRQMARQRGFKVPAPQFVALEAAPTRALLNHGQWVAWCPDCFGRAEDVWRLQPVFFCMGCGNRGIGGHWRPVLFPPNLGEIEARLADLPQTVQNWEPWWNEDEEATNIREWQDAASVSMNQELPPGQEAGDA